MLSDMEKPVTVNLCIGYYDFTIMYHSLSSLYFDLFKKLFKLQFLSPDESFDISGHISLDEFGVVNGRAYYAVNCTMELNRVNRRSLLTLIHAVNISAAYEMAKGFEENFLYLDSLACRFTKILLYKY